MNLFIAIGESFILMPTATKWSIPAFALINFSFVTCQWGCVVHKSEDEIFYLLKKWMQAV